jgi:hypothetical protein
VLATIVVDGIPDAARFDQTMIPILDHVSAGRPDCVVRAYGEMVDVLWNQLANARRFSLLCGYSMGSF